jgi:CRISPR-associated RAMP protein (TIGR02581 family)
VSREPIYSFAAVHNRLTVRGDLLALTALRIGAGRATEIIAADLPVLRDALGAPFIPGASLKGALRAQVEAVVRAIHPDQASDLDQLETRMRRQISQLKEQQSSDDMTLSKAIWRVSTLIDLTFGAPWTAGRVFFKDARVDRTLWFGQFEMRNGVGINRDTETVERGLLYDYEVVPAGVRFHFDLVVENAAAWQLGMLLAALKPWLRGDAQIGGFRSRGLGYVQLVGRGDREQPEIRFITVREGVAGVDDVLAWLNGGGEPVSAQQEQEWIAAFRTVLERPEAAKEMIDA